MNDRSTKTTITESSRSASLLSTPSVLPEYVIAAKEAEKVYLDLCTELQNHLSLIKEVGAQEYLCKSLESTNELRTKAFKEWSRARSMCERERTSPRTASMLGLLQRQMDSAGSQMLSPYSPISSPKRHKREKRDDKCLRRLCKIHYEIIPQEDQAQVPEKGLTLTCAVTSHEGYASSTHAAHIVPHSAPPTTMEMLEISDINHMSNVMPLCIGIEAALDHHRLSFMPSHMQAPALFHAEASVSGGAGGEVISLPSDPAPAEGVSDPKGREDNTLSFPEFKLVVWDPNVRNESIFPGSKTTIGSVEGKPFTFPNGQTPSTKLLSYQVQECYKRAVKKGWVGDDKSQRPEQFGTPLKNDTLYVAAELLSTFSHDLNLDDERLESDEETDWTEDS